jgi:hypothetical protein
MHCQDLSESGEPDLPVLIAAARAQYRPTIYGKMARLQAGTAARLLLKWQMHPGHACWRLTQLRHHSAALAGRVRGCTAFHICLQVHTGTEGNRHF